MNTARYLIVIALGFAAGVQAQKWINAWLLDTQAQEPDEQVLVGKYIVRGCDRVTKIREGLIQ